jgi:hypothetical protein
MIRLKDPMDIENEAAGTAVFVSYMLLGVVSLVGLILAWVWMFCIHPLLGIASLLGLPVGIIWKFGRE